MLVTTLLCAAVGKPGLCWRNRPLTPPLPHGTSHHPIPDLAERPLPPPDYYTRPASPRPHFLTFSTSSWAHPSTSPPKQGSQHRGFLDSERPWLRASLSLRHHDLTLHPAEFSLSCLQAAKFARRLFRRIFSTQPALRNHAQRFPSTGGCEL